MSKCFIEPESCCLILYRMLSCSTLWPRHTLLARCGSFQWRLSTLKCLCGYAVHFHYLQRLVQNPQWFCDIPCSVIHFTLSKQVGTLDQPKKICAPKFLLYLFKRLFCSPRDCQCSLPSFKFMNHQSFSAFLAPLEAGNLERQRGKQIFLSL